ncbi:hypothetical protein HOLleu_39233 [Holothuria leucospilota]|uniref:Methyltransferase type 11 domain-containing protein n=1 Tax=Holothuria leucospilota TaxID=206669 RepID=A0A9Q0YIB8_HOLLE|nr:hypothetical protein HOLleu_39233 [Holothuria leucospilota]
MGTGIMGDLVSDGAGSGDRCNHDDDMRLTLKDAGYTGPIDGVDRNSAMTDIAKSKNVYTNVWNTDIGHDKISFLDDETYDHAVATGCLGRGHIPFTAIPTLIRTIKKGGYLVFTLAWHHLRFEETTVEALENYCRTWDREGLCHLVSCVQAPHSSSGDCHVFVLQRGSKHKPETV